MHNYLAHPGGATAEQVSERLDTVKLAIRGCENRIRVLESDQHMPELAKRSIRADLEIMLAASERLICTLQRVENGSSELQSVRARRKELLQERTALEKHVKVEQARALVASIKAMNLTADQAKQLLEELAE
jgi:hypothetical protein